jgi:hypothetical protein
MLKKYLQVPSVSQEQHRTTNGIKMVLPGLKEADQVIRPLMQYSQRGTIRSPSPMIRVAKQQPTNLHTFLRATASVADSQHQPQISAMTNSDQWDGTGRALPAPRLTPTHGNLLVTLTNLALDLVGL